MSFSVSPCLRGAFLLLFIASVSVAQDAADPQRDALIVETLLRLETPIDLDAKPKTKEAVLRYLKANPGSEQFFQVIERFQIKAAADELLELAIAKPEETAGVKAAELLLKLGGDRIEKTIQGEDTARAAALLDALGNVGGKQVMELLKPLVSSDKPLAIRRSAAHALGESKPGAEFLLDLAKTGKLKEDLNFTVANALFALPDPQIQAEAKKHLKLPASANEKPLPPLPELVKMKGQADHGKKLFFSTATCSKCHIVKNEGKEVGPNLSEIGSKLSKEAFLVAILDPSAGISHNFETYVATTDDGKVVSGLLVSKTDAEVVLRDANAIQHTLKMDSVEELRKLPTSLMPADLQKTMSAQDLVDIVEYLMTLKKE
jgi:putative heme-binding domain-containing protein